MAEKRRSAQIVIIAPSCRPGILSGANGLFSPFPPISLALRIRQMAQRAAFWEK
jgi:hypothetical protein